MRKFELEIAREKIISLWKRDPTLEHTVIARIVGCERSMILRTLRKAGLVPPADVQQPPQDQS